MAAFGGRIIGAIKLDKNTYEEVEADERATGQAMGVVVLSALASGIGMSGQGSPGMVAGVLGALGGWVIAALIIFVVGTKLLPEPQTKSNPGELLRTLGFANAPGLLFVFGVIPGFTSIIQTVVGIWVLAAWVIAVRQALDYDSTVRAVVVCVLGWLVFVGGLFLLAAVLGGVAGLAS
ncbi:MAG: hypothetical protein FVQ81_08765 [Candidatus Glassbacteria bacterium]|nr:hypothetical protein [Candidatus Glassbacteria bacterium]